MRTLQAQAITVDQIEEDLKRLDLGIKQLKIQYDMYFSGGRKRTPHQLRWTLNKLIKQYGDTPMTKYQHRFLFNALATRFAIMTELWDRRMRELEVGGRPRARARARVATRPQDELLASCRIPTSKRDNKTLKDFHQSFVSARKNNGEEGRAVSFSKFAKTIAAQADNLHKKSGCGEIELRLIVVDSKVQVRARPG